MNKIIAFILESIILSGITFTVTSIISIFVSRSLLIFDVTLFPLILMVIASILVYYLYILELESNVVSTKGEQ